MWKPELRFWCRLCRASDGGTAQSVYDQSRARWRDESLFHTSEATAHFPHANESCKRKGKANATGRPTVLCGKCCVPGAETSTVPQCVPLTGKRERARDGVRGGDFLFIRALAPKGFTWNLCHSDGWCKGFSSHILTHKFKENFKTQHPKLYGFGCWL